MIQSKKTKVFIYALVLAFIVSAFSFPSIPVEAKAKTTKLKTQKYEYSVGSARYYDSVTDLKVKKGGKKVKKKKLYTNRNSVKLRTAKWYTSGTKNQFSYKYKTTYGYALYFLKPGTYTVTYNTYESSTSGRDAKGYYAGPGKIVKHTEKITVRSSSEYGVKSVKLGSAIDSYSVSKSGFKTTTTSKYKPYLSTTTAKLTVTMEKGYKLESITLQGYDATGRWVSVPAKNKSKVNVFTYKEPGSNYAPATYVRVKFKTPYGYSSSETYVFYYNK